MHPAKRKALTHFAKPKKLIYTQDANLQLPVCRPYLKPIEEEEEPCKDRGVGADAPTPRSLQALTHFAKPKKLIYTQDANLQLPVCRPYLKPIEEEEEPCKDRGVGADGQQSNHPGEAEEGEENHQCFHQGTLQKEERKRKLLDDRNFSMSHE